MRPACTKRPPGRSLRVLADPRRAGAYLVIALFALIATPPEVEAKLCRGEDEAACERRPECQWLARERRAPEDQARAEASPEYHCVPRPATGDSIVDRQERARRRARDARGGPVEAERRGQRERDMERFELRERVERDTPRREGVERDASQRERGTPRAHREERVERDIQRPDRVERGRKPRQRSDRSTREQDRDPARERERSSRAREARREEREAGRKDAKRKEPATPGGQPRPKPDRDPD